MTSLIKLYSTKLNFNGDWAIILCKRQCLYLNVDDDDADANISRWP